MKIKNAAAALLFGLFLFSSAAFSAELSKNKAFVELSTTLNNIGIIVNPGGPGCSGGMLWDIVVGGCTPAVILRYENTSRVCACSCPELGSCSSQQSGTYPVYGWRLPTSGNEMVSYYGTTSWGACVQVSNACYAAPPPVDGGGGGGGGGTGAPGDTLYVQAYVCNASNPSYFSGGLDGEFKNRIINNYRGFNIGGRCPEVGGYVFWQDSWTTWANQWVANFGGSFTSALDATWYTTKNAMDSNAAANGENTYGFFDIMDQICSQKASQQYGVPVSAVYVNQSGDLCRVI